MATTKNLYTGDGSTTLFPFTFPYIAESDIVVTIDDVVQTIITEYIFSNATTIGFLTAPADGAVVLIKRVTSAENLKATFFPGSAIRARDLNDNFTQNLYVTQESEINAGDATEAARIATEAALQAQNDAAEAKEDAAAAAEDAQEAIEALEDAAQDAAEAQAAATAAQTAATNAEAAATQAATDAQTAVDAVDEILDAVEDGAVVSVNGQGGIVSLGVGDMTDVDTSSEGHVPSNGDALVWNEAHGHWMPGDSASNIVDQGDFAYYPESQQVTLLGPSVSSLSAPGATDDAYEFRVQQYEFWINYLATNTRLTEALSGLTENDEITVCYYYDSVEPVYAEVTGTFISLVDNIGSNPLEKYLRIKVDATYAPAVTGDYPLVLKSPHIADGYRPITSGQTLVYDETTRTWRPEDIASALNISALPTLP